MLQKLKIFVSERKWSTIALLVGIAILVAAGLFLGQKGIWYKNGFLYRQSENVWQGTALGETVAVTRTPQAEGVGIQLVCDSGEANYYVTGEMGYDNRVSVYENEKLIFTGKCLDSGVLLDSDEDLFDTLAIGYARGGETYIRDEDGNLVKETALRIGCATVVSLALDPQEETRGLPVVVLFAAIILAAFFAELWWPQVFFHWEVGRFAAGDVEPSDDYLARRNIGLVCMAGLFFLILAMGFIR